MDYLNLTQYKPQIITLDGPSAVGKGTLSKRLKVLLIKMEILAQIK